MFAISSSPTKRSLLAIGVAASALSLLQAQLVAAAEGTAVRPFRVNIPKRDLVDRRRRVVATRWPAHETVADQSQGLLAKLKELIRYWGTELRVVSGAGLAHRCGEGRVRLAEHFLQQERCLRRHDDHSSANRGLRIVGFADRLIRSLRTREGEL
jgi:hypothetical protein